MPSESLNGSMSERRRTDAGTVACRADESVASNATLGAGHRRACAGSDPRPFDSWQTGKGTEQCDEAPLKLGSGEH